MLACIACRNRFIHSLVQFALETGMRRGEILRVRWRDVSLEKRTLHIPLTKNGYARTIPISSGAVGVLRTLSNTRSLTDDRLIPITENAAKMAWKRLMKRARLEDLRFHDLRHEAIAGFSRRASMCPKWLSSAATGTCGCSFVTRIHVRKTLQRNFNQTVVDTHQCSLQPTPISCVTKKGGCHVVGLELLAHALFLHAAVHDCFLRDLHVLDDVDDARSPSRRQQCSQCFE